jgi:hypothetical protein
MNRKSYIQIIIDTFWETRAPILSKIAEPMLDFRKTLFLTELRRKQKIAERDFFVTLKDFDMQCCLAIDELTVSIGNTVVGYIQAWGDKSIYLNADYNWERNGHCYKITEFIEILKLEVEWEDINDLYVALNSLYPYLNGSVCGWDIEFIEWVLKDINLGAEEEAEPLDLSDTSAVEKIINNDHSEMFSNNGFMLFEHILNEYIKPIGIKGRMSDLIFYYWEMYNSEIKYIHQRPTQFFKWFDDKYADTFGQLKTSDNVKTTQRVKDYSTALEWFKLQKK